MDGIVKKMEIAIKHLRVIEQIFIKNDEDYKKNEEKIRKLSSYKNIKRLIYYGGKKTRGNNKGARQMILADLLQYMLVCRISYLMESEDRIEDYKKLIMRLINQLLLQENISTDVKLRRLLMKTLKEKIPNNHFFEDDYHISKFDEAFEYDGHIIWSGDGKKYYNAIDSLLPKSRGNAIELLIYLYLLQREFGYIVPLFVNQRLYNSSNSIAPPDILLLRKKGEVFGIEIGSGKEGQSRDFSLLTSIPTFSVEITNDQPFRCYTCDRWIIYCDEIIELYSKGIPEDNINTLNCINCKKFKNGNCPHIIYFGENDDGNKGRHHLTCVRNHKIVKENFKDSDWQEDHLVAYFPLAEGLEEFAE